MTKKPEFGISRNGEHIECGFTSHEEAQDRVDELKQEDQASARKGWITAEQAKATHYHIVEISRQRSW